MSSGHKTILLLLLVLIPAVALLVVLQANQTRQITVTPVTEPLIAAQGVFIPSDEHEQVLGNRGAPLTITLFMDVACEPCQELYQTAANFVFAHPKEARLIWKDAPIQSLLLKTSTEAHVAAFCAGEQKAFWPFIDKIIATQTYYSRPKLQVLAEQLQLDIGAWQQCLNNEASLTYVATGLAVAKAHHLGEAPVLLINNKQINLKEEFDLTEMLTSFISP